MRESAGDKRENETESRGSGREGFEDGRKVVDDDHVWDLGLCSDRRSTFALGCQMRECVAKKAGRRRQDDLCVAKGGFSLQLLPSMHVWCDDLDGPRFSGVGGGWDVEGRANQRRKDRLEVLLDEFLLLWGERSADEKDVAEG